MNYQEAVRVIWLPERHSLEIITEAAELVLKTPAASFYDRHQALCLITTYFPLRRLRASMSGKKPCNTSQAKGE